MVARHSQELIKQKNSGLLLTKKHNTHDVKEFMNFSNNVQKAVSSSMQSEDEESQSMNFASSNYSYTPQEESKEVITIAPPIAKHNTPVSEDNNQEGIKQSQSGDFDDAFEAGDVLAAPQDSRYASKQCLPKKRLEVTNKESREKLSKSELELSNQMGQGAIRQPIKPSDQE